MIRRAALAFMLVMAFSPAAPVSAASKLQYGVQVPPISGEFTSPSGAAQCRMSAAIWLQELGQSGVTRLKATFELRGVYDPGWLFTYATSGPYYSLPFPNDATSYIAYFHPDRAFRTFVGPRYNIWVKGVGERPSFWQLDVKIHGDLGEAYCDGITGA